MAADVPDCVADLVTHLECAYTGERHAAGELHNLSRAGKPLLVRYDLEQVKRRLTKEVLAGRAQTMWRYRELLPVRASHNVVSLGEVVTPLLRLPRCEEDSAAAAPLLVKDESRLPTGSFKARGLAVAVSMAKELGISRMAMPSNGNAGAALAAYCRRAGMQSFVFCPADTPDVSLREISMHGGFVSKVNGYIDECGRLVAQGKDRMGWFDTSTLKEPFRIEGKKTMGLELAEQLSWDVPDVILYPTGGGTGLIGMWKAFGELEAIGLLSKRRPRMVAVQAAGCAPLVRAFDAGERHAVRWEGAQTCAYGIRVPQAIGDFLVLDAVRASGGFAIAVDDDAIVEARRHVAQREGLLLCPEGAATYAAYCAARKDGRISAGERCVLFNCATGLKYDMPEVTAAIDKDAPVDFKSMEG